MREFCRRRALRSRAERGSEFSEFNARAPADCESKRESSFDEQEVRLCAPTSASRLVPSFFCAARVGDLVGNRSGIKEGRWRFCPGDVSEVRGVACLEDEWNPCDVRRLVLIFGGVLYFPSSGCKIKILWLCVINLLL